MNAFNMKNPALLVEHDNWVILSAEVAGLSNTQNKARTELLREDLLFCGYEFTQILGCYNGAQEWSFLIEGMPEDIALAVAEHYGQESVLLPRGLVSTDGKLMAKAVGKVVSGYLVDNWSQFPFGPRFRYELDFNL